jgi:phosphopentomutase
MKRIIILLFDSFGMGAAEDAIQFGDEHADTFGHIAEFCALGKANHRGRLGPLYVPNLARYGLNAAYQDCHGIPAKGVSTIQPEGLYGYAQEISHGKDTPSGHWEIAGVPALFDWGFFPQGFPEHLIQEFIQQGCIPGVLGNKAASGTEIINELGDEHVRTGKPIVYTSGDSVFQIAAHEELFGRERLYELCKLARKLVDPYNVGRVIARPFLGEKGNYYRTPHRKDYAVLPPGKTLLDKLVANQGTVIAIGKVADIYAHQGISQEIKADSNLELFDATLAALKTATDQTLIFTNFVDFDSKYGHRRDAAGYAKALEDLDARLPELERLLQLGDIVVVTADHGCDPTLPGSDHTREYIPVLLFGPELTPKALGKRKTFADIGQSLLQYLGLPKAEHGVSFL